MILWLPHKGKVRLMIFSSSHVIFTHEIWTSTRNVSCANISFCDPQNWNVDFWYRQMYRDRVSFNINLRSVQVTVEDMTIYLKKEPLQSIWSNKILLSPVCPSQIPASSPTDDKGRHIVTSTWQEWTFSPLERVSGWGSCQNKLWDIIPLTRAQGKPRLKHRPQWGSKTEKST